MKWLDPIPLPLIVIACILLGLAPFFPEPHLLEKLRMLRDGSLKRPLDIFDLFYHSIPFILLVLKIIRILLLKK
ncbi:RND transporter [Desulfolithobacter sp.]